MEQQAARPGGKSQRKRLQRQLEFYLSESNLRQDKFLQQTMDADGFVPVHVFLSFNKMKMLKATERMVLDAADRSASIRTDHARACIAPKTLPAPEDDHSIDLRTIYIDSFGPQDNHDSLRRAFSKFGKVNLVSLPRFQQSKKFKGFGFVEFADAGSADEAVKAAGVSDAHLRGIRAMSKTRWLDMKKQLKEKLYAGSESASTTGVHGDRDDETGATDVTAQAEAAEQASQSQLQSQKPKREKKRRRKRPANDHIHFGDEFENEEEQEAGEEQAEPSENVEGDTEAATQLKQVAKKQKVHH